MKRALTALLLCFALALTAPCALAAGNVTIAVQGEDGFDDYVSSMFVWDGRLLMASWNKLYTWQPGDEGVTTVEGFERFEENLLVQDQGSQDEDRTIVIGEDELELEAGQSLSVYSQIIAAGDRLFRQASIYDEDGESAMVLVEMEIDEDGKTKAVGFVDLEDQMNIDYGDGYTGTREISNPCYFDGLLYCLSYGENGRELLSIDLEDADVDALTIDFDGDVRGMSPFTEGKLLLVALDMNVDPMVTSLLCYDIESEEIKELGQLPTINWETPNAVAYDEARSMIYYTMSGSVWRMTVAEEGLGEPEEFGDMPLDIYSDAVAVLLDNYYILSSYHGIVGRDVEAEKLPDQRLRVSNTAYMEEIKRAYFPFTDAHPEFMVSIDNNASRDTILQDMMNRSSDVDIYTIDVASSAYAALMGRGFMAELGASEEIASTVGAMYESLQAAVVKEGEIYALPMNFYTDCLSMNKALLTGKLGYTEADMPGDWPAFFALLCDIAESGKLVDYPEVTIMMPGYTQRDAKYNIFNQMMSSYFLWLDQSEENLLRGSEVLLAACAAFEQVDWAALGLPEEFDYEDENAWNYEPENILLGSTSIQPRYYYEEEQEPVILAIAPGEAQLLGLEVSVAFVSPFSTQREAAIEYLEKAFALVDDAMRIALMPGENEPVENSYFEENLKSYDESIAEMEEKLADEDFTDEQAREALMQEIEELKGYREEYMDRGRWDVSPEAIERYRTYAQYGVAARASIWESDSYRQIFQYLDGAITAQQLSAELEKTLQMQRLEGM